MCGKLDSSEVKRKKYQIPLVFFSEMGASPTSASSDAHGFLLIYCIVSSNSPSSVANSEFGALAAVSYRVEVCQIEMPNFKRGKGFT